MRYQILFLCAVLSAIQSLSFAGDFNSVTYSYKGSDPTVTPPPQIQTNVPEELAFDTNAKPIVNPAVSTKMFESESNKEDIAKIGLAAKNLGASIPKAAITLNSTNKNAGSNAVTDIRNSLQNLQSSIDDYGKKVTPEKVKQGDCGSFFQAIYTAMHYATTDMNKASKQATFSKDKTSYLEQVSGQKDQKTQKKSQ